jgi:hypothetical protein
MSTCGPFQDTEIEIKFKAVRGASHSGKTGVVTGATFDLLSTLRLRAPAQVPSSQSSLHSPLVCETTEEHKVCLFGPFGFELAAAGRVDGAGGIIVLTRATGLGGTVPAA